MRPQHSVAWELQDGVLPHLSLSLLIHSQIRKALLKNRQWIHRTNNLKTLRTRLIIKRKRKSKWTLIILSGKKLFHPNKMRSGKLQEIKLRKPQQRKSSNSKKFVNTIRTQEVVKTRNALLIIPLDKKIARKQKTRQTLCLKFSGVEYPSRLHQTPIGWKVHNKKVMKHRQLQFKKMNQQKLLKNLSRKTLKKRPQKARSASFRP